MRAVAVTGVVVYHLWPRALPGGFAGVDVFFVVSGFLITQQLLDESAGGSVRLTQFWARRIRRILPAALVVLGACVAAVVLVMPRLAWQTNLSDITAAALYGENWQLAARAVDYLAAEGNATLVQHYWSLSVEEQFYLAWPLLVLAAVALARRLPGVGPRAWQLAVLTAAFLASFVLSVAWTHAQPATAFFATPTRAWEFAAGGLAAAVVPRTPTARTSLLRTVAGALGLVVVVLAMVLLTGDAEFPGAIALLPVAGATLVVACELPGRPAFAARTVALAPVQLLGRVSYSLYLWHWPLIVAAPWVVHREVSSSDRAVILALSLALAGLTTWAVEDPVRTRRMWRRSWLTYAIPVVGVSCVVAASTTVANGERKAVAAEAPAARANAEREARQLVAAPPVSRGHRATAARSCYGAAAMDPANHCSAPYARPAGLDTAFAASDGPGEACLQQNDASVPTYCVLGPTKRPSRIVAVVGNSHAWRLVPALTLYAEQHGWQIVVAARIDCLGLMTTSVASDGASPSCLRWSAAVQRHLLTMPHLDAVVFAGYRYTDAFTVGKRPSAQQERERQQQVLAFWSALAKHGTRAVVTDDVPGTRPVDTPTCIDRSRGDDPCSVPRSDVVAANPITDLADANPRLATHVQLTQYFCDAQRCHALIGGVVVYFDSHHLTTSYSRSLARYLGDAVAAAMGTGRTGP